MAKFSEEILINFISEFVGIIDDFGPVLETQEWPHMYHYYLEDDYFFRYSEKEVYLCDVLEYNSEEEKCSFDEFGDHACENVQEFAGDKDVIVYFCCEGVLYEDLYEFEAYGAHPKVEGLLDKLRACAKNYGMYWDWADGALKFYSLDSLMEKYLR